MKRSIPPPEQLSAEIRQLFDVLNDESDLACVVIAVAFLDTSLASLLAHKLADSSVSTKLLAPSGAIGSYSTRADLAYALGLVTKGHYQDLCSIGEIRNRFAHNHLQLSFQDPAVQESCEGLNAWRLPRFDDEQAPADASPSERGVQARNQFNISVSMLANRLLLNALSLKAKSTI